MCVETVSTFRAINDDRRPRIRTVVTMLRIDVVLAHAVRAFHEPRDVRCRSARPPPFPRPVMKRFAANCAIEYISRWFHEPFSPAISIRVDTNMTSRAAQFEFMFHPRILQIRSELRLQYRPPAISRSRPEELPPTDCGTRRVSFRVARAASAGVMSTWRWSADLSRQDGGG